MSKSTLQIQFQTFQKQLHIKIALRIEWIQISILVVPR